MVVLGIAGLLCFLAYGLGDTSPSGDKTNAILGACLLVIVFLTTLLTYMQGRQTSAVMATFAKMLPSQSTVIRDGREQRINADQLVVGDIVRRGLGDRVPADLRLIDVKELKVRGGRGGGVGGRGWTVRALTLPCPSPTPRAPPPPPPPFPPPPRRSKCRP
jgi:hypothetical protein